MEWLEILNEIFQVCIIPLLAVLTTYIVKLIRAKSEEIAVNQENAMVSKYVLLLSETIADCVIATNQTYVDALKEQNAFDAQAQSIAFQKTFDAIMDVLSEDAKEYLTHIYGDLTAYITARIEAEVKANK